MNECMHIFLYTLSPLFTSIFSQTEKEIKYHTLYIYKLSIYFNLFLPSLSLSLSTTHARTQKR